jgi:hypothetical protein
LTGVAFAAIDMMIVITQILQRKENRNEKAFKLAGFICIDHALETAKRVAQT